MIDDIQYTIAMWYYLSGIFISTGRQSDSRRMRLGKEVADLKGARCLIEGCSALSFENSICEAVDFVHHGLRVQNIDLRALPLLPCGSGPRTERAASASPPCRSGSARSPWCRQYRRLPSHWPVIARSAANTRQCKSLPREHQIMVLGYELQYLSLTAS